MEKRQNVVCSGLNNMAASVEDVEIIYPVTDNIWQNVSETKNQKLLCLKAPECDAVCKSLRVVFYVSLVIHLQFTLSVRTGGVDFTSTPGPNMLPWHISPRSRAKLTPTHRRPLFSVSVSCFHSRVWRRYLQDGGFLTFSFVALRHMLLKTAEPKEAERLWSRKKDFVYVRSFNNHQSYVCEESPSSRVIQGSFRSPVAVTLDRICES